MPSSYSSGARTPSRSLMRVLGTSLELLARGRERRKAASSTCPLVGLTEVAVLGLPARAARLVFCGGRLGGLWQLELGGVEGVCRLCLVWTHSANTNTVSGGRSRRERLRFPQVGAVDRGRGGHPLLRHRSQQGPQPARTLSPSRTSLHRKQPASSPTTTEGRGGVGQGTRVAPTVSASSRTPRSIAGSAR